MNREHGDQYVDHEFTDSLVRRFTRVDTCVRSSMGTHVLLSGGLAVVVEMRVSHSLGLYVRRQEVNRKA